MDPGLVRGPGRKSEAEEYGMSKARSLSIGLLLIAVGVSRAADTEWDLERRALNESCGKIFSAITNAGKCGEFLFNSGKPVRFTMPESVVPGGGTAIGATFIQPLHIHDWTDSNFTVAGGSSLRQFWFADMALTFNHRRWGGQWNTARDRFQVQFYGHARGLPQMPFYGIGPNSSRSNITNFAERDFWAGANVVNPLASWIAVGGAVEYLKPEVQGIRSESVRSIDRFYNERTAPGLVHQPGFVHYRVAVQPRYALTRTKFNSDVAFHQYQDPGGRYSFHRFRTDFLQTIYPETQREPTGGVPGQFRTQPKYDSVLYIAGRFSAAKASDRNVIPFYLQETIGGSDIDGIATLRGFQDYRFRGPDLFVIQTQYERRLLPSPKPGSPRPSTMRSVAGALGVMAFYDTGEVAMRVRDLSFSNLRHSFGFGLTLWSGERVWFRAYIGLGSGEGRHTFFGISNPSVQNLHM
jgi:hypothetical protein